MNPKKLFKEYLEKLVQVVSTGDAREESFYSTLAELVEKTARAKGRSEIQVTILPRPTEAGNPDFRVWDGHSRIVGYIEAKAPKESLDRFENSEQLHRYRNTFPNLILTNFLEFRLYRNGQRVATAQLGRPIVLTELRQTPPLENADAVGDLIETFLDFSLPRPLSAEELAVELAKRTRFLRDIVRQQLRMEQKRNEGMLLEFYEAFQEFLIGSLTPDEFSDLYSQTVTYGLFAARTRANNTNNKSFSRKAAVDNIPPTIGVLRDLISFISMGDLPQEMAWVVDDIVQVLTVADVSGMMSRFYRQGKGSDPIVHFYETFLAHYDPEERERRGVYYTPDPVVSYIVRSLHVLLKKRFKKTDGLASEGVTLLDPAAGTMTFVARAAEQAVREFENKYGSGGKEEFIRTRILGNFYAFELMMAPYAVGHLKMAFFLEELGHPLEKDERVAFYLTNTLDMSELRASKLPGFSSMAKESHLAGRVKQKEQILVIMGNPPYSGHSANRGKWILEQIETYKQVDGKPLGERNPKWLQDDYVKFLRFAQWKIEQSGQGVVGMITNHSYLDNPTFRGMRSSLMKTFNEIYILDLHGNSLKREKCPDGSPDENVFDIRQGVAIAFFVKTGESEKSIVRHADLWGMRKEKYEWLENHDVGTTPWTEIHPKSEFYLFVPRDEAELERYNTFPKITEIFQKYSVGIVTARDKLTICWSPDEVRNTVLNFSKMDPEIARRAYQLGNKVSAERIKRAQQDVLKFVPDKIVPILYRPFDVRYTYYTGTPNGFHERPRYKIMHHMTEGKNVALITARSNKSPTIDHFFCSKHLVETKCGESTVQSYTLPLYLYPDPTQVELDTSKEPSANIYPKLLSELAKIYGIPPSPKQIFHYIYSVLYAHTYREKYAEFLRLDFPRIPFTADREVFEAMAELGKRLASLHLLQSPELDPPLARFEGEGDNRVAKNKSKGFYYDAQTESVHVNRTQYFAPVSLSVWEYTIGGYQVAEKWLKDRRERRLTIEDIRTYCRIITALARTIELQEEIDGLYARVEGGAKVQIF